MASLTVVSTPAPTWPGGGRRTVLVLGGVLDQRSLPGLRARLHSAAAAGADEVVLDMAALVSCDRTGLLAVARVRGRLVERPSCVVDVVGAQWSQFVRVLSSEPLRELDGLRAVIRELRRPSMVGPYLRRPEPAPIGGSPITSGAVLGAPGGGAQHSISPIAPATQVAAADP